MIDPLNRADTILDSNSELAEALYDVIVFVADSDDPKHNPQVDKLMERVWARTEAAQKERQSIRYKRSTQFHGKRNGKEPTETETIKAPIEV